MHFSQICLLPLELEPPPHNYNGVIGQTRDMVVTLRLWWRLWWPFFGSGIGASEREGHWRLASLCSCKIPLKLSPFLWEQNFWPLSVLFCTNMCSSWKGSEGIESTRQICSVSTSEIKAENEQFDHEGRNFYLVGPIDLRPTRQNCIYTQNTVFGAHIWVH